MGELCEITSSKRIFAKEYCDKGIPFYRGKEIIQKAKGEDILTELYISVQRFSEIEKRFGAPQKGDILLTAVGTLGVPYLVGDEKFYFKDGNLVWLRNFNNVLPEFVYYWLKSPGGQNAVKLHTIGSTQQALTIDALKKFKIMLPKVDQQRRIVSVISSLEKKLSINKKINANLQQQAFCLFDQFLTKASGESVLISDIADLNPKRALTKNQIAKCIDMAQLSTTGAFPDGWVDKPFKGGMRFANGDTLLARITPCLENGKTAFIDFLNEGEVAFGSTEYIVLSPKEGIPPEFLYCLARYPAFVDYAVKNMNGSSGRQRVSAETIGQYSLPRLSDEQYQTFGELASPMFRKMKNNWMENMRLAEVRDALLPKLMSGELNLSDI